MKHSIKVQLLVIVSSFVATAVSATCCCWIVAYDKCSKMSLDPTYWEDRVCRRLVNGQFVDTPCPDQVVSDPFVSTAVGAGMLSGKTGFLELEACQVEWKVRFCSIANYCITPVPNEPYFGTGYPSMPDPDSEDCGG